MGFHLTGFRVDLANQRRIKGIFSVFFAPSPPRHRLGIIHIETEITQRAKLIAWAQSFLSSGFELIKIYTEEIRIGLFEPGTNAIGGCLGHDQDRDRKKQNHHWPGKKDRGIRQEDKRLGDDPTQESTGRSQLLKTGVPWCRAP